MEEKQANLQGQLESKSRIRKERDEYLAVNANLTARSEFQQLLIQKLVSELPSTSLLNISSEDMDANLITHHNKNKSKVQNNG